MNYNTSRKKLVLPEYGRNIQKMVLHLKTIEDRDERNKQSQAVIHVMGNMNPHLRDVGDFKHKLWDHLAIISDFELDIDSPYPTPEAQTLNTPPEKLAYKNSKDISFMHYGRTLESMIKRATEYPEGEEKDYLIEVICNQMKKSFLNWNRELINDELIFSDLMILSDNALKIPEGLKLKESKDLINKPKEKRSGSHSYSGRRDQKRKSGGGHYRRK